MSVIVIEWNADVSMRGILVMHSLDGFIIYVYCYITKMSCISSLMFFFAGAVNSAFVLFVVVNACVFYVMR